jgi:hypothetical protein
VTGDEFEWLYAVWNGAEQLAACDNLLKVEYFGRAAPTSECS